MADCSLVLEQPVLALLASSHLHQEMPPQQQEEVGMLFLLVVHHQLPIQVERLKDLLRTALTKLEVAFLLLLGRLHQALVVQWLCVVTTQVQLAAVDSFDSAQVLLVAAVRVQFDSPLATQLAAVKQVELLSAQDQQIS